MKKKTINIGFPMEYEDDDHVCHCGTFLRENEVKAVEEKLQELQRKDNEINDLKISISDYQEAVGDYQDELKRKDNIINELKEWLNENDRWYFQQVLDKIEELESGE